MVRERLERFPSASPAAAAGFHVKPFGRTITMPSSCLDNTCPLARLCAHHESNSGASGWHPYSTLNRSATERCECFRPALPSYKLRVASILLHDMECCGSLIGALTDMAEQAFAEGYSSGQRVQAVRSRMTEGAVSLPGCAA